MEIKGLTSSADTQNYSLNEKNLFLGVFTLCAIIALLPIWLCRYLPMYDFPQHAAQISLIANYSNPLYGFAGKYEFIWTTPYLLGIGATGLLAKLVGIFIAIKIILSLAILMYPLALLYLIRKSKGDSWWSLIGFAMALAFNFNKGHYNFLVATPLGIFFFTYLLSKFEEKKSTAAILLFGVGLFYSHILVFVTTLLLISPYVAWSAYKARKITLNHVYYLSLLILPCLWLLSAREVEPNYNKVSQWQYQIYRVIEFFYLLISAPEDSWVAAVVCLAILFSIALGSRLTLFRQRLLPATVAVIVYLFAPYRLLGGAHAVYQRVVPLLFASVFVPLQSTFDSQKKLLSRFLISLLIPGWLLFQTYRFIGFDHEASDFSAVLAQMEMNPRVLYLPFDDQSDAIKDRQYRLFSGWVQAQKGGLTNYSFAMHPPQSVRLKKEYWPNSLARGLLLRSHPEKMKWPQDGNYDYFLVRSYNERKSFLTLTRNEVTLIAQKGPWWLYKRIEKST